MLSNVATVTFLSVYLLILYASDGIFAQECAAGSASQYKGNWYCSPVKAITYSGFPGKGLYNKVTSMDAATGECKSKRYEYSGSLAPLNEELSLHVRGPVNLKQLAVYTLADLTTKRSGNLDRYHQPRHEPSDHGHGHQHLHHRDGRKRRTIELDSPELEERQVGALVTATISGKVAVWTNSYVGPSVLPVVPQSSASTGPESYVSQAAASAEKDQAPTATSTTPVAHAVEPDPAGGSWTRQAYYNAGTGRRDGLTFLNHFGGQGSGTTVGGYAFGASLSYASSDGKSGSSSPRTLDNVLIDDDVEIIILSDHPCTQGSCGYTRPGGVAYHGFAGSHKIFLVEFSMPDTSDTGFNGNMPAIWLLNAQVPLTSQYGTNPNCSCWTSGCGEFDLFEVLDAGDKRCKSTLHMAPAGGSSDYFQRPTGGSIKAAVVFTGGNSTVHIQILDDDVEFRSSLGGGDVDGFVSMMGTNKVSSIFKLTG